MVSTWLGGWIWRPRAAIAVVAKNTARIPTTLHIQIFS
jgi:hypothetical protein